MTVRVVDGENVYDFEGDVNWYVAGNSNTMGSYSDLPGLLKIVKGTKTLAQFRVWDNVSFVEAKSETSLNFDKFAENVDFEDLANKIASLSKFGKRFLA